MAVVLQAERGSAETLTTTRIPIPEPACGDVLVRVRRAAVNFADERACRTGLNHLTGRVEELPFVPGGEIVGTRTDTGETVLALCGCGGFGQYVAVRERDVHPVPEGLDDESALSVFVPGLTAGLLLDTTRPTKDDGVVVSGATGAVGTLLLRLSAVRGQRHVVAIASPTAPEDRLRSAGASAVVRTDADDLGAALRHAADGPIDLVLDSIGGPVLEAAAGALGRRGTLVSYGSSSDLPATLAPRSLIPGSRTVTGFWLLDHLDDPARVAAVLDDVLAEVASGRIPVDSPETFGLDDAAGAMAATARRGRTGRVLIDPWEQET
ncbi:quinone oxidoreductase family protein [Actinomycetospora termitidis]|uniref:Zinc-binding alcohol dehydrogenase family protein n=1 Tax=Actinomycetospora termitidis TaxID=3053470 RepID=A0ABT7M7X5_9PSEU|nr:zinc-binding alcohol dehydrogenase family protein [Actinomycetospora sp. Odt1-22]MDL5156132.1 zinc-binding alcohol dehydrogenase family protein [Actinomycetospora sp. Odt1-22]